MIKPGLTAMNVQGVNGQIALYIDDRVVESGRIAKAVPFGWSLSGEGLLLRGGRWIKPSGADLLPRKEHVRQDAGAAEPDLYPGGGHQ